jgi:hypothetical protein
MHEVPPNPGTRRITLAFNAIPTGSIPGAMSSFGG